MVRLDLESGQVVVGSLVVRLDRLNKCVVVVKPQGGSEVAIVKEILSSCCCSSSGQ